MDDESGSPYIRIQRSWRERVVLLLLAGCFAGAVLFAWSLVARYWPAGPSEDSEALRELVHGLFFACAGAGAHAIAQRGLMRSVERAVLDLVRRHDPLPRSALLKACRPERHKQSILLATEQLLAAGTLSHSRAGYTIPDGAAVRVNA